MNITLISGAIAGAIGFGLAWQLQNGTILELELNYANERIAIQRAARAATEGHMQRVSQAQASAQARLVVLRRDADRAGNALDGLREQSADALRAAGESLDACLVDATAKTELLAQCGGRLVDVAAAADGHANDVKTLIEAWPR